MPATVNTPPTMAQIPVKKWANDLVTKNQVKKLQWNCKNGLKKFWL